MKASNPHPRVSFGYPFYHVANNSEMSAKDEYIKLNKLSITHQQLFFYAAAYTFCTGQKNYASSGDTHNARNVRINALAQLPAFQEAFQCKPDSRMMKTVKKQCNIYGKDAPNQR
uniref:Peptidase_M13 domain-containing protein n=1 Tax=Caenorhabditis japonica TaxID=281687 RepID=A0A8R1E1C6_CAEJA